MFDDDRPALPANQIDPYKDRETPPDEGRCEVVKFGLRCILAKDHPNGGPAGFHPVRKGK